MDSPMRDVQPHPFLYVRVRPRARVRDSDDEGVVFLPTPGRDRAVVEGRWPFTRE